MVYNLQYIVLVKKFNNNFFSFIYNECFSRTLVEFNTNMNPYIQVFLAIVIVIILFVAALMVYNKETVAAIRETGKTKKVVPVFSGIVDFHDKSNFSYNTLDPNAANYLNMGNSVNQISGGEYSYNFWLYIDNSDKNHQLFTTPTNKTQQIFADTGSTNITATSTVTELPFVLFLRGSNRVVEYKSQCSSNRGKSTTETDANLYKTDVLVKSPLVKIENGGDALTVEFNTLDSPDGVKQGSRNTCNEIDTDWSFINQYRIGLEKLSSADFSQQWFMVTIVLQDTLPSDPYPLRNKIRARIYINGALKLDKYVVGQLGNDNVSPLKMNQGNIYINPKLQKNSINSNTGAVTSVDVSQTKDNNTNINRAHKLMMADLTYYNYSLSADEVTSLFAAQFNKNPATTANISDSVTKKYLTVTENTNPNVKNIGATR